MGILQQIQSEIAPQNMTEEEAIVWLDVLIEELETRRTAIYETVMQKEADKFHE